MKWMCSACRVPVRRPQPADGLDPRDFAWTHEDGNPMCDNGYFDGEAMDWIDPTVAFPSPFKLLPADMDGS